MQNINVLRKLGGGLLKCHINSARMSSSQGKAVARGDKTNANLSYIFYVFHF